MDIVFATKFLGALFAILTRLMGIILEAIAVEMVFAGAKVMLPGLT